MLTAEDVLPRFKVAVFEVPIFILPLVVVPVPAFIVTEPPVDVVPVSFPPKRLSKFPVPEAPVKSPGCISNALFVVPDVVVVMLLSQPVPSSIADSRPAPGLVMSPILMALRTPPEPGPVVTRGG